MNIPNPVPNPSVPDNAAAIVLDPETVVAVVAAYDVAMSEAAAENYHERMACIGRAYHAFRRQYMTTEESA